MLHQEKTLESRIGSDNKFAVCVVPNDTTVDVLLSIQTLFELAMEYWILRHVQCFEIGSWIWHKDYTLILMFNDTYLPEASNASKKAISE